MALWRAVDAQTGKSKTGVVKSAEDIQVPPFFPLDRSLSFSLSLALSLSLSLSVLHCEEGRKCSGVCSLLSLSRFRARSLFLSVAFMNPLSSPSISLFLCLCVYACVCVCVYVCVCVCVFDVYLC